MHMREVLWSQPSEFPHFRLQWLELEFVAQESIFRLQPAEIIVATFGAHQFVGKQSCLSHEESFHLEEGVAVFANG